MQTGQWPLSSIQFQEGMNSLAGSSGCELFHSHDSLGREDPVGCTEGRQRVAIREYRVGETAVAPSRGQALSPRRSQHVAGSLLETSLSRRKCLGRARRRSRTAQILAAGPGRGTVEQRKDTPQRQKRYGAPPSPSRRPITRTGSSTHGRQGCKLWIESKECVQQG